MPDERRTNMLQPTIYWIPCAGPARIGIMARPRGDDWLDDEITALKREGVDVLVSLLEPAEIIELKLQHEAQICAERGIAFHQFGIPDRSVPRSKHEADALLSTLVAQANAARNIVIHCRAGIGRSALIAACLLQSRGVPPDQVFDRISAARKCSVPDTDLQRAWFFSYQAPASPPS